MTSEPSHYEEFSGNPRRYLLFAIGSSVGLNLYIYLGLVVLLYFIHDQDWILGWKPILIGVLFTIWFARLSYVWIMRLDAQYGSGKGWELPSQPVKLPRRRPRRKTRAPTGDTAGGK